MRRTKMKRAAILIGSLGAVVLSACVAGAEERDVWVKMNQDVEIMRRLVVDTIANVRSPRLEVIEKRLGEIRKELTGLDERFDKGEIPRRERSELSAPLERERGRLQGEKARLRNVSSSEALYLPGYGVIVWCRLRTPLAPEPSAAPSPVAEEASRWEEYRYEVRNLPRPDRWSDERRYDEEHVERILEAVVGAIAREARNLEALPEEERATVYLYGPWGGKWVSKALKYVEGEGSDRLIAIDEYGTVYAAEAFPARSVVMVSLKGSDLAEQREGELSMKQVKRRIEIIRR